MFEALKSGPKKKVSNKYFFSFLPKILQTEVGICRCKKLKYFPQRNTFTQKKKILFKIILLAGFQKKKDGE